MKILNWRVHLKYSKVVTVVKRGDSDETSLCGKDHDALVEVTAILKNEKQNKI